MPAISSGWSAPMPACRDRDPRSRRTGEEHSIAFDEEAYSLGTAWAATNSTPTLRFSYSSMTTPSPTL
jgi:protease II